MELWTGDESLGTHLMQMHDAEHGFVITSFTRPQPSYQEHLEVLLQHAPALKGIQWINLNHARLEVTTIETDLGRRIGAEECPEQKS